jgi:hypothetical protein
MVRRLLSAAVALAGAATASETVSMTMSLAQAPVGNAGPITGKITGTDGLVYSNYKVAILTSGDGGNTWWDKSHSPYFEHYLRDPSYDAGDAQNAAVVIQSDWTWTIQGYQASPNDATSDLWVAMVVPASFDMKWPDYQIEGTQIRGDLVAAALCYVEMSKTRGFVAAGAGGCACGGPGVPNPNNAINNAAGGAAPAASPAAPAASHAASPAPPAASPAPPAASPAAPAASLAAPAASPAAPAASPAAPAASPSGAAALPAASSSGSPAPGSSTLPGSSTAASPASTHLTSGAASAHGAGFPAMMAAAAAAVAGMLVLAQ